MSRAFVKEPDGDGGDDEPLPAESPDPLYLTAEGLAARARLLQSLKATPPDPAATDQVRRRKREIRILERLLARAITVDAVAQSRDKVAFGHWVTVESDDGGEKRYRLVGEDEADPAQGWINWRSPLAQALLGGEIGDQVVWPRPAGSIGLTIKAIAAA